MRYCTNKVLVVCAFGGAAALVGPRIAAQEDLPDTATPVEVVTALQEGIVAQAAESSEQSLEERYEALRPVVERTHDLPYIAELSIRRYWDGLSAEQQERFVVAFERLSVMTYVTRFAGVTPETFAVQGSEEEGNGRVQVHAAIVRDEQDDISLDYLLQERDGKWRIINILADQVSDLALKRAEYHRVLSDGTIDDLIAELEAQTTRLHSPSGQ
jgi:phospholipid transport system substrate-binding protein